MLIKVKKLLVLILICTVFCTSTYAASKEEIIGYVNSQSVCGDTGLFNSYKSAFTRLLKQKKLTDDELNTIYNYLQKSVGTLNKKGVCKIADLYKLTEQEKSEVYNNLTQGASVITNAPNLSYNEKNEISNKDANIESDEKTNVTDAIKDNSQQTGTNITINTETGTMDIYENGVLVDKVNLTENKMTYTGANLNHIKIIIVSLVIFILTLVPFVLLLKKHTAKTRFVKNMLVSLMICSATFFSVTIIFGDKIDKSNSMLKLMSFSGSEKEIQVELNEDRSIKTYPSYGVNYATLRVPSVDVSCKVYFGDSKDILSLGIGHTTWSDMPTENGVIVYSGHNREDMLNNLKDIKVKDEIVVDTSYAKCVYKVQKIDLLEDSETDKLTKVADKETLILYTCYPFDSYVYTSKRFVVYSTLESIQWK